MKGTKTMKKMMMVVAATVAAWCSWGAESISVKEVSNHYPWDGKVDCVFTLSGMENWRSYEGAFELSVKKDGVTSCRAITNALANVNGTYTNTFDCTALFGAGYYPNGGIAVKLIKKMDGVQLWAGGPYFATCNVGATRPQDSGYYFWWGDTVGYKRNAADNSWISLQDGSAFSFTESNCPTYGKSISTLTSAGYIDSTSHNLVAAHDAATAHLGAPWRMMTVAELVALTNKCTASWTDNWNNTGVKGRVVTGATTGYTDKCIFLPAAEGASGTGHMFTDGGVYHTSTPYDDKKSFQLYFFDRAFYPSRGYGRDYGMSIRPVRSAE